jgi:hypothetical protein
MHDISSQRLNKIHEYKFWWPSTAQTCNQPIDAEGTEHPETRIKQTAILLRGSPVADRSAKCVICGFASGVRLRELQPYICGIRRAEGLEPDHGWRSRVRKTEWRSAGICRLELASSSPSVANRAESVGFACSLSHKLRRDAQIALQSPNKAIEAEALITSGELQASHLSY